VATTTPLRRLLRSLTAEVSAALDRNALERSRRGEAREALLQAWVVLNAPGRSTAPLLRWTRRLDGLLSPPLLPPRLSFEPLQHRLARRLAGPRLPLTERLDALDRSVRGLARRTEGMVEQAERTARQLGQDAPRAPKTPAGGREPLELVWGEEEP